MLVQVVAVAVRHAQFLLGACVVLYGSVTAHMASRLMVQSLWGSVIPRQAKRRFFGLQPTECVL